MSMHDFIQDWDLHNPDIMPETRTSKLCRVTTGFGEKAVLKFLKPAGILDEAGGAQILQYYGGLGAVKLLRYDTDAHLLEFADSHDLLYALNHHEQITDDEAARIAADIVAQLHARRPETPRPESLIPLKTRLNELYNFAANDHKEGRSDSIFVRAADLADHLLKTTKAKDKIPLHGDLHHENIVHTFARGEGKGEWLAIDPKGLIGDKAYDVSNMFCNPLGHPEIVQAEDRAMRLADIFSETLGYDRTRILGWGAVHSALSASWSFVENRPREAEEALKVAETILDLLPVRVSERQRELAPAA